MTLEIIGWMIVVILAIVLVIGIGLIAYFVGGAAEDDRDGRW